MCAQVLKEFSDFGYFTGTVLSVEGATYRVQFTDGDVEALKRPVVIDLIFPAAPCVFSSIKLTGGSSRVLPNYFAENRLDLEIWAKVCSIDASVYRRHHRREPITRFLPGRV